jgi:hypothetical protein
MVGENYDEELTGLYNSDMGTELRKYRNSRHAAHINETTTQTFKT